MEIEKNEKMEKAQAKVKKEENCNGIVKIIAIKTERAKNNKENERMENGREKSSVIYLYALMFVYRVPG